ncbi:MAG: GGDEF domain-containing protein [Thermodesulfobacteriota bacterium]
MEVEAQRDNGEDLAALVVSSHEIARRALPVLSKHGIPVTPTNYRLWYEYFSGHLPALKEALDQMLRDGLAFTTEVSLSLYRRFFSLEALESHTRALNQAEDNFQAMTLAVVKELILSIAHTSQYSQSLQKHVKNLEAARDLTAVQYTVAALIEETGGILKNQDTLKQQLERSSQELKQLQEELRRREALVHTDELTKLDNRRSFNQRLDEEFRRAQRYHGQLSLILLDLDDFKKVNDAWGHLVGDRLLAVTAKAIKLAVRGFDFTARFGGEEFAVICPETDLAGARIVAERLRTAIDVTNFTVKGKVIPITISAGVATLRADDNPERLVDRADQALYVAKQKGKNLVATEIEVLPAAKATC